MSSIWSGDNMVWNQVQDLKGPKVHNAQKSCGDVTSFLSSPFVLWSLFMLCVAWCLREIHLIIHYSLFLLAPRASCVNFPLIAGTNSLVIVCNSSLAVQVQEYNKLQQKSTKLENLGFLLAPNSAKPTNPRSKKQPILWGQAAIPIFLIFFVHALRSRTEHVPQRRDVAVTGRLVDVTEAGDVVASTTGGGRHASRFHRAPEAERKNPWKKSRQKWYIIYMFIIVYIYIYRSYIVMMIVRANLSFWIFWQLVKEAFKFFWCHLWCAQCTIGMWRKCMYQTTRNQKRDPNCGISKSEISTIFCCRSGICLLQKCQMLPPQQSTRLLWSSTSQHLEIPENSLIGWNPTGIARVHSLIARVHSLLRFFDSLLRWMLLVLFVCWAWFNEDEQMMYGWFSEHFGHSNQCTKCTGLFNWPRDLLKNAGCQHVPQVQNFMTEN